MDELRNRFNNYLTSLDNSSTLALSDNWETAAIPGLIRASIPKIITMQIDLSPHSTLGMKVPVGYRIIPEATIVDGDGPLNLWAIQIPEDDEEEIDIRQVLEGIQRSHNCSLAGIRAAQVLRNQQDRIPVACRWNITFYFPGTAITHVPEDHSQRLNPKYRKIACLLWIDKKNHWQLRYVGFSSIDFFAPNNRIGMVRL